MEEKKKTPARRVIPEPYLTGMLEVSKIHSIYWNISGNPDGPSVLILNGGPGGNIHIPHRGFFDPTYYKIVEFDPRGCGKSTPSGSLEENTTWDQVGDIEKLRIFLGIEKWYILNGNCWGGFTALLYAQSYPDKVGNLLIRCLFLGDQESIKFYIQEGSSRIYPDYHEELTGALPENERNDIISGYYKRVILDYDEDEKIRLCKIWFIWIFIIVYNTIPENLYDDEEILKLAINFSTFQIYYYYNKCFLDNDQYILENCYKIKDIPTILIHGRHDFLTPVQNSYKLHKIMNNCKLIIVPEGRHSGGVLYEATANAADSLKILNKP